MPNRMLPLRDPNAPAASGEPRTRTWNLHTSEDGTILAGIWESTPGVWEIDHHAWEYCHVLSGRCTIQIEGKPPVELKTGDVFIVETGTKGTLTVHEAIRKYYVFALSP